MASTGPAGGLRASARQVLASLIDIGRTRLELATVELEEERLRLARLWIGAVVTLFLLFVGIVLASACIVLASAPENQLTVLALLAAAFLGAAGAAAWRWRRLAASPSPLLYGTLRELRRDEETLSGTDRPS